VVRTRENRIDPYYQLLRLPGQEGEDFVMLRPYVPYSDDDSRRTLTAFMVANSDPDRYGELTVYRMSESDIDGPSLANSNMLQAPVVRDQITPLNQPGSNVQLGNMLLLPINNSLLYVRPLYVTADNTSRTPEVKGVIVSHGQDVAMRPTLREALQDLFPDADPSTFEDVEEPTTPGAGEGSPGETDGVDPTYESLVNQGIAKLAEAEDSLRTGGDLGTYQRLVREGLDLLRQAEALLAAGSASSDAGDGSTPSTTAPASPDTTVPGTTTSSTTAPSATQASLRYWAAAR
jgi:uncharacterized membrane protein (UPF0182 family)